MGDMEHPMMKMFWHIGYERNLLVFGWDAESDGKMVAAVAVVFFLALMYEGVKFYRIKYSHMSLAMQRRQTVSARNDSDSESVVSRFPVSQVIESLIYGCQVAISFTLMLFVMTFNIWLMLSAVLGMMLGYCLFSTSSRLMTGTVGEDCCS